MHQAVKGDRKDNEPACLDLSTCLWSDPCGLPIGADIGLLLVSLSMTEIIPARTCRGRHLRYR
ncbi:hypothetical protein [Sutterella wadsworthensis]|uniref:hypothetical protein n=1 Tax=Sutterella wadsworthensis TaxID=40545 RepID=UPI00265CB1DF|nr:hypothetical protein [Sutterella wadsworthensis]